MATLNPRIKKAFLSGLTILAKNPFFRLLFEEIAGVIKPPFRPNKFTAVLMPDNFLLGVNDMNAHPTWRTMAETDFEKSEAELVKELLPFSDAFIDVGAHIGFYTCLVGELRKIKILAFEPNATNYQNLLKNIQLNKLNVKSFNIALGDRKGDAKFYGSDAMGSAKSQTFAQTPASKKIKIDLLDNYLHLVNKKRSIFIKIDVEGGEFELLQGARNFLKTKCPSFMLLEIVKKWGGGNNPNFFETFEMLKCFDYKVIDFEKNKFQGGNYLFVHKNKIKLYEKITSN